MTEPADEGGAGSDPSMMQTTCRLDGNHWVINGRKEVHHRCRGRQGRHRHGEVGRRRLPVPGRLARSRDPHERVLDTIDSSMPGGHADRSRSTTCASPPTRCSAPPATVSNMRKSVSAPARLSHCMRWLGARHPRQRDRDRLRLPPPRVRKTAGRSRRRRLHAGGEPDRSETVGTDDRLVRRRARHRLARRPRRVR